MKDRRPHTGKHVPPPADALVGRRRELRAARDAVDAALSGTGGLLLITGEAGIGKTRLTETLARRITARTIWSACWDDPGTPAFWPWATVLRDCAAGVGLQPGDDLAPVLGPAPRTTGPARQLRLRLFDGVAAYLTEVSRRAPLVILIEDLHDADGATLDLLRFLAGVLRGQRVAFVGTHRYPDLAHDAPLAGALGDLARTARMVALYGLSQGDVAALIEATTGTTPSTRLVARIVERTGGNPLFVTEVVKLLKTGDDLDSEHIPIPVTVQQVIAQRMGHISGAVRDVLDHASVLGQVFSERVLAHVAGASPGQVADLLDEAVMAGLVRRLPELGQFGFTHALVRDVLYAGVPSARRRARHRHAADTIAVLHARDLDEHAATLADHYVLALPDADTRQALTYTRRAAARALRTLAYEQAARRFDTAIELAERAAVDEAERIELLLARGDARLRAGDWPGASETYEEVAASARRRGRSDELARAALGFGAGSSGFEVRLFDQRQLDLLREALDELSDGEPELRAWVLARLSVAESFLVADDVRVVHSSQALDLARQVGDPKLLSYALSACCDAIPGPEHTDHRLKLANEMVRLGAAARDAESELLGRRFRLVALLEAGDIPAVDAEIEAFALTADRLRWPLVAWYPPLWRGMRAFLQGRLDDAERFASEAKGIGVRGGSVNAQLATDYGLHPYVLLERGQVDEVHRAAERFLDDPEAGPNTEAWTVLLLVRMGRLAQARALLDRLSGTGFPLVADASWLDTVAALAEGCADLGHAAAAERLLPVVAPFADRFATGGTGGCCLGSMHRHLGLLTSCLERWDDADAHFRRALAANRRAGATLMVAHTLRQHADMLRGRDEPGDRDAAEAMLTEASEIYRQLDLGHWIERPAAPAPAAQAVFRRDGETWIARYGGHETRMRDIKGMAVLARLLAEPARELHVLDLVSPDARAGHALATGDTGDVIDARARAAYKRRLGELEAELEDATRAGDTGRAERAGVERDALVDQLAAAYGLGGRVRRSGDPVERARSTVTKQIRGAIARIQAVHPSLALHLRNSVKTGRHCSYVPEHPVSWQL